MGGGHKLGLLLLPEPEDVWRVTNLTMQLRAGILIIAAISVNNSIFLNLLSLQKGK